MKKIVLLMVLCAFLFSLVSCQLLPAAPPGEEEISEGDASEVVRTYIVENGKTNYQIVYREGTSEAVINVLQKLQSTIREKTTVRMKMTDDYLPSGATYSEDTHEILIGKTAYPQTQEILSTLRYDEYAIRRVGNKLVVAAHSDEVLIKALGYIINTAIPKCAEVVGDAKTIYLENYFYQSKGDYGTMKIDGAEIQKFQIVYAAEPKDLQRAAEILREYISTGYGYVLPCGSDKEMTESAYEILIGNTNRTASSVQYAQNPPKLLSYRFVAEKGKLMLLCGGAYSAVNGATDLTFHFPASSDYELKSGTLLEKQMLDLSPKALAEGSDIRVMTSNILAERWVDGRPYPTTSQRAEIYAALLAVYQPNLVGAQETDMPWVEVLPYYLDVLKNVHGIDYTWIENRYEHLANLTSLLYRAEQFELLESGMQEYSYVNHTNYKIRVLAWGVFRDKSTGHQFALINTHCDGKTEYSPIEVAEEKALIDRLDGKYQNLTFFCTGDYNNHVNNGIENFKTATGFIDSKEAADANGVLANHNTGIPLDFYIDHVYTNLNPDAVKHWETIESNLTSSMSDHLPQYGDYSLN